MKAEISEYEFKPFVVKVFFETQKDVDDFCDDYLNSEDIDDTDVGNCIKEILANR
jgi:hypothetical protein